MTPFKEIYRRIRLVQEVNAIIKERNLILDKVKENLYKAQERMKKITNKNRKEVVFVVGDHVFMKVQPYHFCSLAFYPNERLSPYFYGLYKIVVEITQISKDTPSFSCFTTKEMNWA